MGEEKVTIPNKKSELQQFVRYLLNDLQTLELMLEADVFEKGIVRIGAEQELCLVDKNWKPAMNSLEILEAANNELFTTELAKFNLETNVDPIEFKGDCLKYLENDITNLLDVMRKHANSLETELILIGILPTIRKFDLDEENITPLPRYHSLLKSLAKLRGGSIELNIKGIDELMLKHHSPMLEACNTGFQVHLQVDPSDFANKYNIAQAIAGPAMAAGTNSPLLFGKRLWSETRVALFQQSIDTRKTNEHLRERSPRVMFGNKWLQKSIIEIYKEDISRFRVLLRATEEENSLEKWKKGEVPKLMALQVHNGTVYRWNRPCYGVKNGVPHIRIENRVLPAGPTVKDEIANAALWFGLMNNLDAHYGKVSERMEFDEAKSNFLSAAQKGMDNNFCWFDNKKYNAADLILNELIPIAKEGLEKAKIDKSDTDEYLGILEDRIKSTQTGSIWVLNSFNKLLKETTRDEALTELTSNVVRLQKTGAPVHTWPLAEIGNLENWEPDALLVEEFMTTDLFTVEKDDILELVCEMMDYKKLRYVLVEDKKGKLEGVVSSRGLLKHFSRNVGIMSVKPLTVRDIMIKNPVTILPSESITKAMDIMEREVIGCLPVVENNHLVGVVTEQNFRQITNRLIKRLNLKMKDDKLT